MSRRGLRIRILATLLAPAVVGSPSIAWPSVARAATANLDNWSVTYTTSDGDGVILTGATSNGVKVFARASPL